MIPLTLSRSKGHHLTCSLIFLSHQIHPLEVRPPLCYDHLSVLPSLPARYKIYVDKVMGVNKRNGYLPILVLKHLYAVMGTSLISSGGMGHIFQN